MGELLGCVDGLELGWLEGYVLGREDEDRDGVELGRELGWEEGTLVGCEVGVVDGNDDG